MSESSSGSDSCIDIAGLEFHYGNAGFQLRVPRCHIGRARKVAFIGPSGSGKTTLLHLLAGILRPHAGSIELEGQPLHQLSDSARRHLRISRVGLIFQEFELLDHLTVRENILLPYLIHRGLVHDASVETNLQRLVERTGIASYAQRRPRALSQGERQRVAICRALVTHPAIILADEPTGNLDPATTSEILDLLLEEVSQVGATLIMVTHDHGVLDRFDEVIDFQDLCHKAAS